MQDSPKEGPDDGPAKQAGDGLQVSGGVLDFSSGSEDEEDGRAAKRKTVSPGAVDGGSGGNVASGPGRLSLLQHGFSKLLESVKRKAGGGDGESSSDVEENPSEEESEDEKREATSLTVYTKGSGDERPPKVATKVWELSSNSDTGDTSFKEAESRNKASLTSRSDDAVRTMQQKQRDPGPSRQCFENYSDESDDLDVAMKPKNDGVEPGSKVGDKRRGRSGSSRAGQSGGPGRKSRYSEDIEMVTSSEDEHTPVKRARHAGRNFSSPQNTVRAETPKAVSFTGLKARTIDSVLGRLPRVSTVLYFTMFFSPMNDQHLSVRRRRAGGDVHPLQPAGGGRKQSGGADWQSRRA